MRQIINDDDAVILTLSNANGEESPHFRPATRLWSA
jgi:hypothetical protein